MTETASQTAVTGGGKLYAAIWRWHFYAGLFVAPFFFIAAVSGLAMTLKAPVEALVHDELLYVAPSGETLNPETLLNAVRAKYPHADVLTYIPARAANRSAEFIVAPHGPAGGHGAEHGAGGGLSVYADPYTGEVLGALDRETTFYAFAKTLHGTLFLGAVGDHLIEIAAGFGVMLIVTGLFLWAPRGGKTLSGALAPRITRLKRSGWRSLHAATGFWVAGVLLFFLLSGLAWTPIWGGKLTQAWSSFPSERFAAPAREETHASLNHSGHRTVPWALEQTPLPAPHGAHEIHDGHDAAAANAPGLAAIVALAREKGFTGFRVTLPKGEAGAWTVMAATISGDITDPRRDRTLHVDAATGEILADIGFADYSPMGKAMAAGVPLHQGELGAWNIAFNVIFCFSVLALTVSGAVMWWLRRPEKGLRLVPPPMPADRRLWGRAALVMLAVSLLFPLSAALLAAVIVFDIAVLARAPGIAARVRWPPEPLKAQ